jgi:DNA ligase-1
MSLNGTLVQQDIQALHVGSWTSFVLIAEAWHPDLEQAVISGLCRTEVAGAAKGIQLHVHDILSLAEFDAGESVVPYKERLLRLDSLMGYKDTEHLTRITQTYIHGAEALKTHASIVQGRGGEGVCYRPENAGWESGNRGTNLIRIKEKITFELEAIGVSGVEAGSKGGLKGVLQVKWREFGKEDGKESIQDIRGMKHSQLLEWRDNPELIVGKIVEVEAMKFTAFGMLREPRFKSVRLDKNVADV